MAEAPGGAGIGPGDGFDHLHEVRRRQFRALERARQHEAIKPGVVQRRDDLGRELPLALHLRRRALEQGREAAGALDVVLFGHRGLLLGDP